MGQFVVVEPGQDVGTGPRDVPGADAHQGHH
jgi:hypothetical protein